ncbi:MAG: rod shape-determining protein [Clostridia bacterium]|nr:rod shape-determining protein [Clostridia bacterium]
MSKNIGIDLGTANTLLYMKGRGIVLREPSVVAVERQTDRVRAVGREAKMMLGKTPGSITAHRPIKDGVIADFEVTAAMLRDFFRRVSAGNIFSRPYVAVCVPYGVTEVERRAFKDATLEAGARAVAMVTEPIAAAIGSGLRVSGARGCMVVDIGGGTTEVAVLSLGGIVRSASLRIAGDELDESIMQYIKAKYGISIGESTAEMLKKNIGSVHWSTDEGTMDIQGLTQRTSVRSGLPAVLTISSGELREAMYDQIEHILKCICTTLENTPPELSADIYDYGIMLTGGSSLMRGLPQLITERTGIRVTLAKRPLDCVALGLGRMIETDNKIDNNLTYET